MGFGSFLTGGLRWISKSPLTKAFAGMGLYSMATGVAEGITSKEAAPVAALRTKQALVSGALGLAGLLPGPMGWIAAGLQIGADAAFDWEAKKTSAITAYGMGRNKFHYSPVVLNNRTMASVSRGMARIEQSQANWSNVARGRAFSTHQRYGMSF